MAAALRDQLIQVAFARNASAGMNDKMELLCRYLAGDEFAIASMRWWKPSPPWKRS